MPSRHKTRIIRGNHNDDAGEQSEETIAVNCSLTSLQFRLLNANDFAFVITLYSIVCQLFFTWFSLFLWQLFILLSASIKTVFFPAKYWLAVFWLRPRCMQRLIFLQQRVITTPSLASILKPNRMEIFAFNSESRRMIQCWHALAVMQRFLGFLTAKKWLWPVCNARRIRKRYRPNTKANFGEVQTAWKPNFEIVEESLLNLSVTQRLLEERRLPRRMRSKFSPTSSSRKKFAYQNIIPPSPHFSTCMTG